MKVSPAADDGSFPKANHSAPKVVPTIQTSALVQSSPSPHLPRFEAGSVIADYCNVVPTKD
jgi:hypothetical protein